MGGYIYLTLGEDSVNVNANTSRVVANLYYVGNGLSWNNNSCAWWININGSATSGSHGFGKSGTQWLGSHAVTVGHNSDGSKWVSASASFATGVSIGTLTTSNGITLTTIPRKSSISKVSPQSVKFGETATITINAASSGFKHTVYAYYNGTWNEVGSDLSGGDFKWTPPKNIAQYFTATPAGVTLRLRTFNGSSSMGDNDYSSALAVNASDDMVPSITIGVQDTQGYLSKYGALVQGKSIVKAAIVETLSYGSPIKSRSLQIDREIFNTSPATATGAIQGTSLSIKASVADDRNMTASVSISPKVLPYGAPIATASAFRCNNDGIAADNGTYAKVTYSIEASSLNEINTHYAKIQYKAVNDETWNTVNLSMLGTKLEGSTVIGGGGLNPNSTYEIRAVVTDDFSTTESNLITVPTEFALMNFTNEGMAIGKKSERNRALEIADGFPLYTGSTRLSITASELATLKSALGVSDASLFAMLKALGSKSDIRTYQNQTLDLSKGVADSTYSKYPYHVDLALSGCTANHVPYVTLGTQTDLISAVCMTGAGYVRFFATQKTGSVSIPTIMLIR